MPRGTELHTNTGLDVNIMATESVSDFIKGLCAAGLLEIGTRNLSVLKPAESTELLATIFGPEEQFSVAQCASLSLVCALQLTTKDKEIFSKLKDKLKLHLDLLKTDFKLEENRTFLYCVLGRHYLGLQIELTHKK